MSVRNRWPWALFLIAALLVTPSACLAGPLDIPAAVPAKFRALVRARVHTSRPHRSWESRFKIETRQGYDLSVVAVDDVVGVIVERRRGAASDRQRPRRRAAAVTAYVARGTVTSRRIEASFGRFGRIAVRFRPSRRVVKSAPRRCRGRAGFTSRPGVFVGRVRFTGERRYVAVRAHRAKGRIRSQLPRRCISAPFRQRSARYSRSVGSAPNFFVSVLQAGWREALASTEFLAFKVGKRTLFLALTEESRGSLAVLRYALAVAPSRSFVQNEALTSATVEPPWPFVGAGSYAADAGGTETWAGRLSASFPGAPRVPLAGPQFWVDLESGY